MAKEKKVSTSPLSSPEAVSRLLLLLLTKLGADSAEVGAALGVDSSRIRQLFPMSKIKRVKL